jgi:hypothetical protein
MKDGKRSYWEGKKKDEHTLNRLSESKFKKVYAYDANGDLTNIYLSIKEAAITIFKDYRVVNGSGCSKIYSVLCKCILKNRFKHNHYWFKEKELLDIFNGIPLKLNFDGFNDKTSTIHKKYNTL